MNSIGYKYLSALITSPDGLSVLAESPPKRSFFTDVELPLYDFVLKHLKDYGKLPSAETIASSIGARVVVQDEPCRYYNDLLVNRYVFNITRNTISEIAQHLNKDEDPTKAIWAMQNCVNKAFTARNMRNIADFSKDASRIVKQEYDSVASGLSRKGIPLGWPTFDDMVGGMMPGDVFSLVGPTGAGKTYFLLYSAYQAWLRGYTPLFVSMEMKVLPIMQRLVAMHCRLPITKLKTGRLSNYLLENKFKPGIQALELQKDAPPFYVIDGNLAASVRDITSFASLTRPSSLYVDGAYLLTRRDTKAYWEQKKADIEEIKAKISTNLEIPAFLSYQYTKEYAKEMEKQRKKNPNSPLGSHYDIGGGASISQTSTVVLGIDCRDDIETTRQKQIKITKGRDGQTGHFTVNWIFDVFPFMDFSEVPEDAEDQLTYL